MAQFKFGHPVLHVTIKNCFDSHYVDTIFYLITSLISVLGAVNARLNLFERNLNTENVQNENLHREFRNFEKRFLKEPNSVNATIEEKVKKITDLLESTDLGKHLRIRSIKFFVLKCNDRNYIINFSTSNVLGIWNEHSWILYN